MTNKIILGTVQFGLDYGINNRSGKPGMKEITLILDKAHKNNIRLLDTAEAYGNSQELIGEYHQQSQNKFNIVTKYHPHKNSSIDIKAHVLQNLKTLHVDYLYGYMFHSFSDFETHYEKCKNDINELKRIGLIKKFGVSVYSNNEMESLLNNSTINLDLIQLPFNVFDNAAQRSSLISRAKAKGIEIHTRSVFLQGLIFKNPAQLSEKLKPMVPYMNEVNKISKTHGIELNDLALNYAVQQKNIDYVLVGVDTSDQLEKNIMSLQNKISDTVIAQINSLRVNEIELLNPSNWK